MRFGIAYANTMKFATGPGAIEAARAAEDAGFESLWTVEHVVYPDDYASKYPYADDGRMPAVRSTPIPDPLVWLSWVAAVTTRIRLATGILILPERNPVVLAKELATLDHLSGGRVELGIGVGWLEEEFAALGIPWARRGARTDEYIGAMRALWATDGASYDGEFVHFERVSSNPKPANGNIPIIVGGHTRAAAERAGRFGDGLILAKGDAAELAELLDIARQAAASAGRDPSALSLTAGSAGIFGSDPVGAVQELADAGVTRVLVSAFSLGRPTPAEAMGAFAERVIAPTADL